MGVIALVLFICSAAFSEEIKILSNNFYPAGLNLIYIKKWEDSRIEIECRDISALFPATGVKSFFAIPYSCRKLSALNVVRNGQVVFRKHIKLQDRQYPVSRITVKERKKNRKVLERIKKEYRKLRKILTTVSDRKYTESRFFKPLKKLYISTPFGAYRIINGKKRSVHWGTDFRAPEGTPVYASLSGKVVLAQELFYTGKTVVIDHGKGLFTLYAHLSHISVREGQMVKGGKIIGKVGSTGRSTGPHLHFGVYLKGIRVDPVLAFKLKL
ncbi:M23 family metallopeptidase [Persephonella atlantica]|uniref:M23 family metallopeptidase n=1 Tax=Persephonella atlantica TaxID=2699429 RepID=A0ABS1GI51_9AQUI|nr:M23 family metallopeptidase [Persephonella atlantica]MBK3332555.1 M23 family metallopeptidase [Persephonella atlantica]